jgi:hypothetical protein
MNLLFIPESNTLRGLIGSMDVKDGLLKTRDDPRYVNVDAQKIWIDYT